MAPPRTQVQKKRGAREVCVAAARYVAWCVVVFLAFLVFWSVVFHMLAHPATRGMLSSLKSFLSAYLIW
ncbi:hypothetical protein BD311DRAFT_766647 [Dichomitus squalens]|uniref:Uncharacterized protein n=1 Tax=Dichomitus squalens TaxID=114155 RepID=A0A4Q9MES7_9APHY|nr:hypothetical protein BD311DRAFT_766647 [Dichomitus squalens]